MRNYTDFFKDKKATLMGLGLLGRGLGDAIFLAEHGVDLIITDLRDAKTLAPSLAKLKKYKNIKYTLGGHKVEDFRNRDFIVKAAGVALDSPYVAEAVQNKIPVEMDASLFARLLTLERSDGGQAKLMPKDVTLVGVTGTRGKSTTTALIYEILKEALGKKALRTRKIYKGGNLVAEATLPLLKKVKSGDIIVLELDSWQLQGFHDARISPHIAVFTTFLDDHLIYYKGDTDRYFEDKVAIFKYQKAGGVLIAGERVAENIGKSGVPVNGDFVIAKKEDVPRSWDIPIPGEHNLENIACALAVAKHFKIPEVAVKKAVEHFKPVAGRLELIRTVKGVKFYNDTNATTPDATIAGLRALGKNKNMVLICGGTDKGLDMTKLVAEIPKHCKGLVLLKETGTERLKPLIQETGFKILEKETLKKCVGEAVKLAKKGDIVLFSPAFASFGKWFKNEYDRGEQFVELIKNLT
ncbi:MAG: UDP-N-acetylmuramoyl-L-alanine--D-glutamate ligase [Candidatus Taylorbacteria bacterium]|nr:UDP-N-acetylmuramoyl-L-alanine--D-glutamate ligase [Candidatus Taylorbacteria bacterium]